MCYPAAANEAVSHADLMLPMIHRRASDDKVVVRKAALQVVCVCVCVCCRSGYIFCNKCSYLLNMDFCVMPSLYLYCMYVRMYMCLCRHWKQ